MFSHAFYLKALHTWPYDTCLTLGKHLSQLCSPHHNVITCIHLTTKFQPRYHSKLNRAKSIIDPIEFKQNYLSWHPSVDLLEKNIMHQHRVMFMNFKIKKLSKTTFLKHLFLATTKLCLYVLNHFYMNSNTYSNPKAMSIVMPPFPSLMINWKVLEKQTLEC